MKRKQPVKFKILLMFLLITIAQLIAVSIYCYLIKYLTKQKLLITVSQHKKQTKRNYVLII